MFTFSFIAHSGYINIKDDSGCYSTYGYPASKIGYMSLQWGACFRQRTIEHEFLHSFGMYHEHQRPDRDEHIVARVS